VAALLAGNASALEISEQSAMIAATGFASAATDHKSPTSAFFNPSALTRFQGFTNESTYGYKRNSLSVTPSPLAPTAMFGASGELMDPSYVSGSSFSYQLNDKLWLGLVLGTDFATKVKSRFDWSGQVYGRSNKIVSTGAQPTIAVKVNDWLSIGGGLIVNRLSFGNRAAVLPWPGAPSSVLDMDSWGIGATAGVTITPARGTTIGIGYRSTVSHRLEGHLQVPGAEYGVAARVSMPERLNIGVSQRFGSGTTLFGDLEWINYSRMGTPALTIRALDLPIGMVSFAMKDIWVASLGVEQQITDRFALRAGLSFRQDPSRVTNHSIWSAGQARTRMSIGGSYQITDSHRVDLTYVRGFAREDDFAIGPGNTNFVGLPFAGKAESSSNTVLFALTYQSQPERRAEPAAPMVRKF
jgi:long-chain fatty acid transport protein